MAAVEFHIVQCNLWYDVGSFSCKTLMRASVEDTICNHFWSRDRDFLHRSTPQISTAYCANQAKKERILLLFFESLL